VSQHLETARPGRPSLIEQKINMCISQMDTIEHILKKAETGLIIYVRQHVVMIKLRKCKIGKSKFFRW
jgi:GTP cyclohydrolase II